MSDENTENNIDNGFELTPTHLKCIPCRCRKKNFVKNKKKIEDKEGRTVLEETVKSSIVSFGRGASPEIQPRTLTTEERIEALENKIEEIKISNHNFQRSISVDEKILLNERLTKLEKEVEELKHIYRFQLMD